MLKNIGRTVYCARFNPGIYLAQLP